MDHRRVERLAPVPGQARTKVREGAGEELPLQERDGWAHRWLVQQFVAWLDGGPAMATNVEDNLQSVALIFAAIESSRTGQPIRVQEFLTAAKERAILQI
jgi:hypothetical protein